MIYLASPYSDNSPEVVKYRVAEAARWTAEAWRRGYTVFCPVLHGQALVDTGIAMPMTHEFWLSHDMRFLAQAEELWVLMLPGWGDSKGVNAELDWWHENGSGGVTYWYPDSYPAAKRKEWMNV